MIVFGTIAGGAGAALTGGNFWQGAATGLIVSGLNHSLHQGDSKPKPKKSVRVETVTPSLSKIIEVEGNVFAVADIAHNSSVGNWLRGGAPKLASASKFLKIAGNTLGGIGVALEANQVYNGEMSWSEFSVDTVFALAPMICPALAPVSLGYFASKAIYEYSSNKTLFTKPE